MKICSYKELVVWQRSMRLVSEVYSIIKHLPSHEQFVLVSQIIRAAISIPSNIAEGWGRNRKVEFIRFLQIAYGSSAELETQLLIVKEQYPYCNIDRATSLLYEVQKMLAVLINKLKFSEKQWQ